MKLINIIFIFSVFTILACSNNKSEQKLENGSRKAENAAYDMKNKINICELIPADLLAQKINGKVLKTPQHSDYGPTQGCEYEIDPAGPDNYEYCAVWLYPASMFEDAESALETAKGLNQKATFEHLTGYGDESYVIHNETEEQSIIHVLLKNKSYLEIKAEKFEDAQKITELVLSKLK